jgi:hypothetical protein
MRASKVLLLECISPAGTLAGVDEHCLALAALSSRLLAGWPAEQVMRRKPPPI